MTIVSHATLSPRSFTPSKRTIASKKKKKKKTYAVFLVNVLEAENLARHADGQTARDAELLIIAVHVLKRRRGRRLAKVDRLIATVGVADEGEAAAANARVVHANDADAKRGADHGIHGVALEHGQRLPNTGKE